jgi:activating signal cointegrator 1
VKGISLYQPYASFIAWGWKKFETRSRSTAHRGELAIQATQKEPAEYREYYDRMIEKHVPKAKRVEFPKWEDLPRGAVVCLVNLIEVFSTADLNFMARLKMSAKYHTEFGDFTKGRYAWLLRDVRPLSAPLAYPGAQGFFNIDPATERKLLIAIEPDIADQIRWINWKMRLDRMSFLQAKEAREARLEAARHKTVKQMDLIP